MAAGFPGKIKERETGFEFGNAKNHRKDKGFSLPVRGYTHSHTLHILKEWYPFYLLYTYNISA